MFNDNGSNSPATLTPNNSNGSDTGRNSASLFSSPSSPSSPTTKKTKQRPPMLQVRMKDGTFHPLSDFETDNGGFVLKKNNI